MSVEEYNSFQHFLAMGEKEEVPASLPEFFHDFAAYLDDIDLEKFIATHVTVKELMEQLLGSEDENIHAFVDKWVEDAQLKDSLENQMRVLCTILVLLKFFERLSFTGPTPNTDFLTAAESKTYDTQNDACSLNFDGEEVHETCKFVKFLIAARRVYTHHAEKLNLVESLPLWEARVHHLHGHLLSGPSPTLKKAILDAYEKVIDGFCEGEIEWSRGDKAVIYIEYANACVFYYKYDKAKEYIEKAEEWIGLEVQMTGRMGKRTKYQSFEVAQLVAETKRSANGVTSSSGSQGGTKPSMVQLDETNALLETPSVKDSQSEELSIYDQLTLLARITHLRKSYAQDEILTEQIGSLVNQILKKSLNWLVYSKGLLSRSRNEFNRYKTKERSVFQTQALVDQFKDETPSAGERLRYLYSTDYPSYIELIRELGDEYCALGAVTSAYQIFEHLQMWDDAIECLCISQPGKAESLARKRLEERPTPKIYCLLGDMTSLPDYYERAWKLSGEKYARAMRSLGKLDFFQSRYDDAIKHMEMALKINPLYSKTWFTLGCAYLRTQNWEGAVRSFTTMVSLEPDSGSAWANLAVAFVQQGKKPEAIKALENGLRENRENWKMWENYLFIVIEEGLFYKAKEAIQTIVYLGQASRIKGKYLRATASIALESPQSASLLPKAEDMFKFVTSQVPQDPDFWEAYVDFVDATTGDDSRIVETIELKEKECRARMIVGWEHDKKVCEKLKESIAFLEELLKKDTATEKQKQEGALFISTTTKKIELCLEDQVDSLFEYPQSPFISNSRLGVITAERKFPT